MNAERKARDGARSRQSLRELRKSPKVIPPRRIFDKMIKVIMCCEGVDQLAKVRVMSGW